METAPAKTFLGFKPDWVLCIPKSPKSSSSYFHNHPGTLTCLTWDHWKRREIQNTKIQKVPEKNLAQLKLWNPLSPTQHGWEVAWALQRSADECGAKMSAGFNCGKPLKSLKYFSGWFTRKGCASTHCRLKFKHFFVFLFSIEVPANDFALWVDELT